MFSCSSQPIFKKSSPKLLDNSILNPQSCSRQTVMQRVTSFTEELPNCPLENSDVNDGANYSFNSSSSICELMSHNVHLNNKSDHLKTSNNIDNLTLNQSKTVHDNSILDLEQEKIRKLKYEDLKNNLRMQKKERLEKEEV